MERRIALGNDRKTAPRQPGCSLPSKRPERRQHVLKAFAGAAGAQIAAPEFFDQLLVAVDDAIAAAHARFRRITPASVYA